MYEVEWIIIVQHSVLAKLASAGDSTYPMTVTELGWGQEGPHEVHLVAVAVAGTDLKRVVVSFDV